MKKSISVQIDGAVENPGIIEMSLGSTVDDALSRAVLLENADTSMINRNTVLKDGDVLMIPFRTEVPLISINHSAQSELEKLKGIGPVLALRIIEYRRSHGLFQRLEDIKKVKGIGDKIFERIREQICL
ncbi:MAG: helix-hairpin-helix domain-containing protein [Erysipelotrichaceae bacterium]|nr:helix-hairpin-helix domain-containing protein [Erysipelotrichaceae bacterium]MBQ4253804.1 helix-hairpin-helix domain-containing protein [Erysipelotrichaceae bacterium]